MKIEYSNIHNDLLAIILDASKTTILLVVTNIKYGTGLLGDYFAGSARTVPPSLSLAGACVLPLQRLLALFKPLAGLVCTALAALPARSSQTLKTV